MQEIIEITCKVQIESHLFINYGIPQGCGAAHCAAVQLVSKANWCDPNQECNFDPRDECRYQE